MLDKNCKGHIEAALTKIRENNHEDIKFKNMPEAALKMVSAKTKQTLSMLSQLDKEFCSNRYHPVAFLRSVVNLRAVDPLLLAMVRLVAYFIGIPEALDYSYTFTPRNVGNVLDFFGINR